ncbi:unnamed protein product [Rhizophagus irregularis]|nr:unnamed protein product [Rhizophagus irregularis]
MDNVSIINEDKEENINVSDIIQENINNNISDTIQEGLDNEPSLKIATENISLDTTFASWEEAEIFLEEYGRRNGFSINKYQISRNKSSQLITKRTFTCEFGGKFKSNKKETGNQRNTRTKKRQCPWHINLTFPEHATNITISLFENEHNHELRSDTCEFNSRYREISKEIMDEIEIMTKHANLSITVQRNLLKARFPKINYTDSDLSNAIQRIKIISRSNMHNDASDLLIGLVQKKQENPHFFLKFELDADNPKLGSLYNSFIEKFYKCRNSLCEPLFFSRWTSLLENFPLAKDYLLRVLWPSNKSWARCYLKQIFTAGIESTSRVEGMNAIIKKTVRSNSTLCQLVDQLSERLISEIQWGRFHEYRSSTTSSISVSIGEDLFPSVIKIMEKYLCINTITAIKVEMAQCLYLQATIALFSELDFTQEQEIEGFIEDSYDAQQITLQSIIDEIGKEDVKEIWKICDIRPGKKDHMHYIVISNEISFLCTCLTTISRGIICRHYFRVMMFSKVAGFHISMIPERWYQDVYQGKPLTQETGLIFLHENENLENNTNNDLEIRIPTRKAITIPKTVPIMKKAIEKRKKYGKLWGMAREATLLALESNDNEMELILQDYINKKKRNYEMISESNTEIEMEQNHINESTNISNEFQELGNIQNPLKAKTKGRPPTKRYRSSIEHEKGESSKSGCSSRNTYKCRICGQCGHNAAYHKNDKLKERQQ